MQLSTMFVLFLLVASLTFAEKPSPPAKIVDIIFVVDSSGSIGRENYQFNFRFIAQLLKGNHIGETGTKVALIYYGAIYKVLFPLTGDSDFIQQKLSDVPYMNSSTRTDLALYSIIGRKLFSTENGGRENAAKIVVLITDGKSSAPDRTKSVAAVFRIQPYTVIVLGVGALVDKDEMELIASSKDLYFPVGDYTVLENVARSVSGIVWNTVRS